MLKAQVSILLQLDEDPIKITESDVKDGNDPNQIIDSDDEANEDVDIDWNCTKFIKWLRNCVLFILWFVLLDCI